MARPRSEEPSSSWSFWLPNWLISDIDAIALAAGVTRNALVRRWLVCAVREAPAEEPVTQTAS